MNQSSEGLISGLVRDLRPVDPLPPLRRVASGVLLVVAGMLALTFVYEFVMGIGLLKPRLGATDLIGIAGHLSLASGALALALAASIPGRGALERLGCLGVVLGASLTGVAIIGFDATPGDEALRTGWLRMTASCLSTAAIPALVPAVLLARFAARGAPHRPLLVLGYGSLAALGFATLPGQLSCPSSDALHALVSHQLAPVVGSLFVLAATTLVWQRMRPRRSDPRRS